MYHLIVLSTSLKYLPEHSFNTYSIILFKYTFIFLIHLPLMDWALVALIQRHEQIGHKQDYTEQTDATQHTQNKTDKTLQHQPELSEVTAAQGEQDFPQYFTEP